MQPASLLLHHCPGSRGGPHPEGPTPLLPNAPRAKPRISTPLPSTVTGSWDNTWNPECNHWTGVSGALKSPPCLSFPPSLTLSPIPGPSWPPTQACRPACPAPGLRHQHPLCGPVSTSPLPRRGEGVGGGGCLSHKPGGNHCSTNPGDMPPSPAGHLSCRQISQRFAPATSLAPGAVSHGSEPKQSQLPSAGREGTTNEMDDLCEGHPGTRKGHALAPGHRASTHSQGARAAGRARHARDQGSDLARTCQRESQARGFRGAGCSQDRCKDRG